MSAGKYTPGPWVESFNGARTFVTTGKPGALGEKIADVGRNGGQVGEERANARLIAAAPDLLEAAYITSNCSPVERDLALMADDTEITLTFCAADLRQIRAAIAKAVGK